VSWLGLEVLEWSGDRVVGAWDIRPDLLQPYGIVHGGVHASVIETLASLGAATWYQQGQVVGVSNQTDFLRAVREGRLTATGTPIHRGRLQQLWLVEIRDENERIVARGQVRLQNLPANRV
jgi:1,4-dihydroxy-2-naphthoyl-CoA hydrolase